MMMICSNALDKRMDAYYSRVTYPHIYDVFHSILPNWYQYEYIINIYTAFFLILLLYHKLGHEFIGFIIPIYIIRCITIHLTVLPKHDECEIQDEMNLVGGCYDKIFSGHFSVVLLTTLLLWKHKLLSIPGIILLTSIHAFFILATRAHYTIDIVVSLIVVLYIFQQNISL
jgi:hypothetical protein